MKNQNIVSIFSLPAPLFRVPFTLMGSASDGSGDFLRRAEKSIKMKLIMRNEPNFRRAKNELNPIFHNN